MREIKFRAWDKKEKTMILFGSAETSSTSGFWGDGVDNYKIQFEREGETNGYNHDDFNESAAVDLMQYTGLKDKNGVEIYEGDIIMENVHYFVDNFKDASILGTDKNGKRTYERIEKKPMHIFLDAKKGWKLRSDTYNYESPFWAKDDVFFNKIEVIGNIYENPELITK